MDPYDRPFRFHIVVPFMPAPQSLLRTGSCCEEEGLKPNHPGPLAQIENVGAFNSFGCI